MALGSLLRVPLFLEKSGAKKLACPGLNPGAMQKWLKIAAQAPDFDRDRRTRPADTFSS
jgi:hypothetical protein